MNLYKVMMEHFAPKDSEKGIYTYLIAESDKEVYEWIKSEKRLKDGRVIYNGWSEYEDDDEEFEERIINVKGQMYDDELELTDLYYGVTLMGWDLEKENLLEDEIRVLVDLDIAIKVD